MEKVGGGPFGARPILKRLDTSTINGTLIAKVKCHMSRL